MSTFLRAATPFAVIAAVATPIPAQAPQLLADLRTEVSQPPHSDPAGFTELGNGAVFAATESSAGREPWWTDLASGITQRIADVRPGPLGSDPLHFIAFGGRVFFSADDGAHGRELWSTDGTPGGTALVVDLHPGALGAEPHDLCVLGSMLYFAATTAAEGTELWRTDGTAAGTRLVVDLDTGSGSGDPAHLTAHAGALWFAGRTAATGRELWRSDGTAAGTSLVADLAAGAANADPDLLRPFGAALLFATPAGLWRTDGTLVGTILLDAQQPRFLATEGGLAWYLVGSEARELRRTTGVPGAAAAVATLGYPGFVGRSLAVLGGRAVAMMQSGAGWLPFAWDGANAIVLPSGANPASTGIVVFQNRFVYPAGIPSVQLFRTDGTAANTAPLINLGTTMFEPSELAVVANGTRLLFRGTTAHEGREPWITDGYTAGSHLVHDIAPNAGAPTFGSDPRGFVDAAGTTFFVADDGLGRTLWRTDGTPTGTVPVTGDPPTRVGAIGLPMGTIGNRVLFVGNTPTTGYEPFVSDGTAPGTIGYDLTPGVANSLPGECIRVGDMLFFVLMPSGGLYVLHDDGQPPLQLTNAAQASQIEHLAAFGNHLLFAAFGPGTGKEPWISDGTPAGTHLLADLMPGNGSSDPALMTPFAGACWFRANGSLYRTDGTAAGTSWQFQLPGALAAMATAGDALYLSLLDLVQGVEWWRSDGTQAGTTRIVDLTPGSGSTVAVPVGALGDVLLFRVTNRPGQPLFRTDGTAAGTYQLPADWPTPLVATADGTAWFTTASTDFELWSTDGTVAGTVQRTHFAVGAAGPQDLALSNGRLFFGAVDPIAGNEPWTLDPGASVQVVGYACSQRGTAPTFAASTPHLGTVCTLRGDDGPAQGLAIALLSLGPTGHFHLPGGHCELFLDPQMFVVGLQVLANGAFQQPLPLPGSPAALGLSLRTQAVLLPGGAIAGAEATPGLALTIGP